MKKVKTRAITAVMIVILVILGSIFITKSDTVIDEIALKTGATSESSYDTDPVNEDLDETRPVMTISAAAPSAIYAGESVTYTVSVSDNIGVVAFSLRAEDITLEGFTAEVSIVKTSTYVRTVTFTNVQGAIGENKYFTIAEGVASDAAGNVTKAKNAPSFEIKEVPDTTRPAMTISAADPAAIYAGESIAYTVSVSDNVAVDTFEITKADITMERFTAEVAITGSGNTRTITFTNVQGTVGDNKYFAIAEGVASDAAGNVTKAKNAPSFEIKEVPDTTRPAMTISAADPAEIYAGESVVYTVSVSDNVAIDTFEIQEADITMEGFTAEVAITGSGNTRTVTFTNVQGAIGNNKYFTVAEGVASDAAGNVTKEKNAPSFEIKEVPDTTRPAMTISAADPSAIYAGESVVYTVSVSDNVAIDTFEIQEADITMEGFTAEVAITGSGNTRTITFTNVQGAIGADKYFTIAEGVASDAAGNVTKEKDAPAFEIKNETFVVSCTPPNPKAIYVGEDVVYNLKAEVSSGIASFDLKETDITMEGFTAEVTITGNGDTRTITFTNVQGTVGNNKYFTVAEGVIVSNIGTKARKISSPAFEIKEIPDETRPAMTISAADPSAIYAGESVVYTVSVSDNVAIDTFEITKADITMEGFTAEVTITGSGNTRTITFTNVQGTVGDNKYFTIAEGVASDEAGNVTKKKDAPAFEIKEKVQEPVEEEKDTTRPAMTISAANPSAIYAGESVVYTVSVSDNVAIDTFEITKADITMEGFTAEVTITGSGLTRTVTFTNVKGTVGGNKYFVVAEGVAKDAAGNVTKAKNAPAFTIKEKVVEEKDTTRPAMTISAANPSAIYVGEKVVYTVSVNDNVGIKSFNLTKADITMEGFTAEVTITGSGLTRTITFTNVQGAIGADKYFTIAEGVANDAAGNVTKKKNAPTFTIKEKVQEPVDKPIEEPTQKPVVDVTPNTGREESKIVPMAIVGLILVFIAVGVVIIKKHFVNNVSEK